MSMRAFTQHDVGGPWVVLDSQQADLLELLRAAEGEPVSYGELRDAGIELPASTVAGLELAGLPIVRCVLDEERGAGARLEQPSHVHCGPAHTVGAMSSTAEDPVEDEWLGDRLMRVIGGVLGRAWAVATALVAWAACNGPPVMKYAVRWLLRTGRTAGERTHEAAQRALSTGTRRVREAAVAILAWLARVVPPVRGVAARWLSQVAHVTNATSGLERAGRSGNAERAAASTRTLLPWASRQTRTRCLAVGALAAVAGTVLALVIGSLGASAGGTRRLEGHRHDSRPVTPNAGRRSSTGRTTGTTR